VFVSIAEILSLSCVCPAASCGVVIRDFFVQFACQKLFVFCIALPFKGGSGVISNPALALCEADEKSRRFF
jgi:hypothetical protein